MKKSINYIIIFILLGIISYFLITEYSEKGKKESSLEFQKICADGAKKYFDKISSQDEIMTFHYNSKLDKCFLVTDLLYRNATSNSNERIKIVYDVFEEKKYGYLNVNYGENTTICSIPELKENCTILEFNEEVNKLLKE